MTIIRGFKEFILRGNVIDLAVGFVMGAAFGKVVDAFVAAFIAPLVKVVTGGHALSGTWRVNDVIFDWAAFVNAVITFLLTAAAVYFFVVVPVNKVNRRGDGRTTQLSDEAKLLTEIRDELRTR
ncbi:large conductance mechanosensitive channel protein MscL [Luedemannella flava]|uniref:Large-conductance mechanosensitive channel n=1 Tax=Luedemannella flava TaxID=349316 RepID=A0ABN2LPN5_9ACTN